jgi:hypothetical protein
MIQPCPFSAARGCRFSAVPGSRLPSPARVLSPFPQTRRLKRRPFHTMPRPNTLLFRLAKPSVPVTRSWANLGLSYLDCVASTRSEVLGVLLSAWCLRARLILSKCQHVALKLFVDSKSIGIQHLDEINIHKYIENSSSKDHPCCSAISLLLDSFNVNGSNGQQYQCLVHPPLWKSILDVRHRNPTQKLPEPVLAFVLKRLF